MGMKAMKAAGGRAMKAKRVSIIAKGKRARAAVLAGRKQKTQSGLTKDKLMKNKYGKIVSKARSAHAKRRFATSTFKTWINAVKTARKALSLKGFVAVNGKSAEGKALYAKAKSIVSALTGACFCMARGPVAVGDHAAGPVSLAELVV